MVFSQQDVLFAATNTRELHLILLPTEKCNFRCKYCYEDHFAPRMKPEIQEALVKYIDRSLPNLSHFTIDWFGGEPLLGLPVIRKINGFVLKQMNLQERKFWFRSGITTNGYLLTPEVFFELVDLGVVQYQITIDGPKDLHDFTRIQTNGEGSFDRIWENLLAMKSHAGDFDVLLRIHIMKGNIERIQELVEMIEMEFGDDERFRLFLKPIKNLGGDGSEFCNTESLIEGEEIADQLQRTLKTSKKFWSPNPICHASKINSHIIRADGRVARCTTALDDPVNTVGKLTPEGNLELDRDKIIKWVRGIFDMDSDSLYCPLGGIDKI